MNVADEVIQLFEREGHAAYFGEAVSVLQHSLQTAWLARQAEAENTLIAAALVHDIGHLLHGRAEDVATHGIDGRHEIVGDAWLRLRFGPAVTEPVRLHVDAKRFLCRVEPAYYRELSPSSIESLQLQGGPFNESAAGAFQSNAYYREAIALRRWDDAAKLRDTVVPGLEAYREVLLGVAIS